MNPVNPINSNFQSEWIRYIRINPNDSEKLGFIRIDRIDRIHSDCKYGLILIDRIHSDYKFGLILNGPRIDSDWKLIGMIQSGSDTNSGMFWKISDWFRMNFNPKLSPGDFINILLVSVLQSRT